MFYSPAVAYYVNSNFKSRCPSSKDALPLSTTKDLFYYTLATKERSRSGLITKI